nr:DUF4158 domain-containing protein [Streptomyces rimosus]
MLKTYGERENTRLDHVRELRRLLEYRGFAEDEPEVRPQPGSLAVHGSPGGRAGSVRFVPGEGGRGTGGTARWRRDAGDDPARPPLGACPVCLSVVLSSLVTVTGTSAVIPRTRGP